MTLVRLSSQITLKLQRGDGAVGKLGEAQVQRLLGKLHVGDPNLVSAYLRFEGHGDERRLCAEWRQLLQTATA